MSISYAYDALPGRVVFGDGAAGRRLPGELERLGARRVLLVGSAARTAALRDPLGARVAGSFETTAQHVPVELAHEARAAAAQADADALVAVGGGSAIGVAKAIALTSGLPIAAIPTTYSGSEMTPIWGLTEAGAKTTGRDPAVLPRVVVYDPRLTLSLPVASSVTSGFNALAHAVAACWAPEAGPLASLTALEGIRALARALPEIVRDPAGLPGRERALHGAHLAATALAVAGTGLHHRICHVLGGAYDLPHAELHTVLLAQTTAFVEAGPPAALEAVRDALGVAPGVSAAAALHELALALGAPTRLGEIGMEPALLGEAVALVCERLPDDSPRPVGEADVRAILTAARDGRRPA
jgi:maleylacetate reductase